MEMTVNDIETVCRSRSAEEERHPDEAHAYGYVARHLEERPGITLEQLARDLGEWMSVYELSAKRSRGEECRVHEPSSVQKGKLHEIYEQQTAVYREVLSWAKGERSVEV
jgi:hypothetical protein